MIFWLDLALESRAAIWLLYIVLLLASSHLPQRFCWLLVALGSTALIGLAPLFSTAGYQAGDVCSRGLGLLVLWAAAVCQQLRLRSGEEQARLLTELEQVYNSAPLGMALLSPQLTFLRINENLAGLHHLPTAAHYGQTIHQVIPELAGPVEKILRQVFATGEPVLGVEMQARLKTDPDHDSIGQVDFFPIKNAAGQVEAVGVFVQDITERKQAEEALRLSEERYRCLTLATAQIVWTATSAGEPLDNLETWTKFTGQSQEEVREDYGAAAIHPEDRQRVIQAWTAAQKQPGLYEIECRIRRHDGVYRHMLTRAVPILGPDERIHQWVGTCTDITERKDMEAALKAQEELYRTLFDSSPDAIALMDMDANIIMVNQKSRTLYGYESDEDLRGKPGLSFIPADEIPRVLPYLESLKTTGKVGTIEMISQKKDGMRIPIEATAHFLLDDHGRPKMLVGFSRDISARKKAEQERELLYHEVQEQREQLRSLSRRLMEIQESERRFLAGELHDEIGQMLTVLHLNLDNALPLAGPEAAPLLQESLHTVDMALQQVRALSLDLRPAMLDLLGLEAAVRWYADRQAQRSGFTLQLVSNLQEQRLPPEVETAGFRIAQESLTNVVRHARAHNVTIKLHKTASALHITIRDDGIGFDLAQQHQLAAAGKSVGLLGMQERVHLLGGRIDVASRPGQGTCVEVFLPLNDLPSPAESQGQDNS